MCKYLILYVCYVIGITDVNSYFNSGWHGNNFVINPFSQQILEQLSNKRPRPEIRVYYETYCPECIKFFIEFTKVVQLLGPYLDIWTYPYGNAQTFEFGNGTIAFNCQHGPEECYGNMLHACSIDLIPSYQQALVFNGYLMGIGSTDAGVNQLGPILGINPEPIKQCAKSRRAVELHKYYGVQTYAQNVKSVPYVLLNGVKWMDNPEVIMKDVCAAFTTAPLTCRGFL